MVSVSDRRGAGFDGTDVITGVETLRFADGDRTLAQSYNTTPTDIILTGTTTGAGASAFYDATYDKYYAWVGTSMTWENAMNNAQSSFLNGVSGTLVHVNSAAEGTYLLGLNSSRFWAGGSDKLQEGVWRWFQGDRSYAEFFRQGVGAQNGAHVNWFPGEPNNTGGEHYLERRPNVTSWNDNSASHSVASFVQWSGADVRAATQVQNGGTVASLMENATAGNLIGTLSATDANTGDVFTYSIVGGTAASKVTIANGNELRVATGAVFNHEAVTPETVTIRVTDASGATRDETFTLAVVNVNEGPSALGVLTGNNLLLNSSFENLVATNTAWGYGSGTTLQGWTIEAGSIDQMVSSTLSMPAVQGNYFLDTDGAGNSRISQTVHNLTAGVRYQLSISIRDTGNVVGDGINIYWGGQKIASLMDATGANWSAFQYAVVGGAGDGTNKLTIEAIGPSDAWGLAIDNLSLFRIDSVQASAITIVNPGFESQTHADGSWSTNAPGWVASAFAGGLNPQSAVLSTQATEGNNVGFTGSTAGVNGALTQTLSETLAANTRYDLTVNVGRRLDGGTADNAIRLYAGSTLLTEVVNILPPVNGWTTATLSFDSSTLAGGSPLFGQALRIELAKTAGNGQINWDNVRMTKTPSTGIMASVVENSTNGTSVATLAGADPDLEDILTYSLTNNAGGRFTINATTGVISVANSLLLNFESATSHAVTVRVTDAGGLTRDFAQTISVTNANEAPVFDMPSNFGAYSNAGAIAFYNATFDKYYALVTTTRTWEAAMDFAQISFIDGVSGTLVNVLSTAEDAYLDSLMPGGYWLGGSDKLQEGVWRWFDGDTPGVQFSSGASAVGGLFTNWNAGEPNNSGGNEHYLAALGGALLWNDATSTTAQSSIVQWRGADVRAALPSSVAENAVNGTSVISITATDPDAGDSVTYSLTNNAGGRFAINATTGVVTVANSALLDFESALSHVITVRATDTGGLFSEVTRTIAVTNVNEAPTALSLAGGGSVVENSANGTVVATFTGTDLDASDTLTYTLTNTAGGRFAVNASTGVVTVANGQLLDFEAATSHDITVRVTDTGGLTRDLTQTITLTNDNEAPTSLVLSAGGTIAENVVSADQANTYGAIVATFTGTDPDASSTLTYSLISNPGNRFSINTTTGVLSLAGSNVLDFEANPSYNITVRVTDQGGLSRDLTQTITVTNINEAPYLTGPSISYLSDLTPSAVSNLFTGAVHVDQAFSSSIVLNGVAYAKGVGTTPVSGAGWGGASYAIGGAHEFRAIMGPNRGFGSFQVRVLVDGVVQYTSGIINGSTTPFEIVVPTLGGTTLRLEVNDGGNGFSWDHAVWADARLVTYPTLAENSANGTTVATFTSADADAGDTRTYSLVDSAGGRFAINATTGALTVANGQLLDFDTAASHTITVRVTDAGGLSQTLNHIVRLTNVNEAPSALSLTSGGSVAENSANGTVVATFTGTDPDAGDTLTYNLVDNAGGRFAINSTTGVVTVANSQLLDFEGATSHGITVRVTDGGGLTRDVTQTIQIQDVQGEMAMGTPGVDSLSASTGDDTLDGLASADTLSGGVGNDTYVVDNAGDVVVENPSSGTDTIQSTISFTLASNVEVLSLTGSADINASGTSATAETLVGNTGRNTLNGGAGADTMLGGIGNDTYIVDNAGDVVTESSAEGTDTIFTSVTFTLAANAEVLSLTGSDNIDGYGNSGSGESLFGNSGNNTLDGGAGADTMIGGAGNDTYMVDNNADVITEGSGAGTDVVMTSASYTLGSNVENLTMTGATGLIARGNSGGNTMVGNSGNNTIEGMDGADTLYGGAGDDVMDGGWLLTSDPDTQNDMLYGEAGNDTLYGGGQGNDTLDGGIGADSLVGGNDNDLYYVDNTGDIIDDSSGTDTVISTISYTLNSDAEHLTLSGVTNINAVGNSASNTLVGNSGNNTLDGAGGADTMSGGLGNDTYVVNHTGDVVTEAVAEGQDTIQSSITFTIANNVEVLSLTGSSHINAYGGAGNDFLLGNTGNNTLEGGAGNDDLTDNSGDNTLIGGLGNDTYRISISTGIVNTIIEAAGEGGDSVLASIANGNFSFTLSDHVEHLYTTGSVGISTLVGNSLSNIIVGNWGSNFISGLVGNDSLSGSRGNDTYLFDGIGDGLDIVNDNGLSTDIDSIQIGTAGGLARNNIALFQQGNDLQIAYVGSSTASERITVTNHFLTGNVSRIENITFIGDNFYLTDAAISTIITNMANYAAANSIALTDIDVVKNNANLMAIVNAGWTS